MAGARSLPCASLEGVPVQRKQISPIVVEMNLQEQASTPRDEGGQAPIEAVNADLLSNDSQFNYLQAVSSETCRNEPATKQRLSL